MDLRFGIFVVIFLIIAFIWQPTDSKNSGNRGSSKKKNSTKIQLSEGIATNPFLQQSILSNVETNPFLSFYGNRSQFSVVPNIFLPQENNFSSSATWINSNNPFLNIGTDIRVDTESSVAPESVTQTPYRPLPSAPVINTPSTSYTPAPANNPFITSHTHNPSIKVEPPSLSTPSLSDIKIGPTKTKSELKCEEYVRELVGTTEIMSLVGTSPDVIKVDNVCRDANRLIVGGTEAKPGEFPHMVALGRRNSNETFTLICGATLISHTWVLSAAHCTYGPNGGPTDARIGFHRLTDQHPGVTIAIKTMIRHPDYNPPAMYADIALVQLMNAVTFSTSIRPACLYVQYDTGPMNAWISGWGVTEFAGEQTDRLQKAQLDLVDNLACTIRHNSSKEVPYGVTPSMVCAGDPHGGWTKDSCQGDSGGPLQIIHPKNLCFFQVIGITSFGQGCAIIDAPGVYTRVSHYISYIENIVWP
ncbi:serine protease snake-like [Formica exsecta]|uniref:serine protease snake-like n=1 Tax=Formica exsecta TaxID=72781 RepID=UPI001142873A|nr:serine protease snake-like [Formica exsecta]